MTLREQARYAYVVPQVFTEGPVDPSLVARVAQQAEDADFESLWTQSQLVGRASVLEPLTTLSYVAGFTSRIGLGIAVLVLTEHFPVQLAKQVATLDQLCEGRLTVSFGVGAPGVTASIGGHDMDRRVRRLLEGVELMERLWVDEEATFDGEIWQLDGVPMQPKPVQRPHPPVWFSGIHETAVRRAAKRGSGWMGPGAISTEHFGQLASTVRAAVEEMGKDPAEFTVAKRVYLGIEDGTNRAASRMRDRFAAYSNTPDAAMAVSVVGTPESVADQLGAVIAQGADLVLLNPVFDFEDQLTAAVEVLGKT